MKSNTNNILLKFGNTIKKLRKQRGYSQEEFAQIAELDRSYMGSVERGERNVSLLNIEKIVNALDISLETFFKEIYD
ncbi:MAG: helix-turn-helix transcriptional regulator [Campylobacterota bacterium]|nr:helix-turn-helix transcriptional regulator [Campylobacterota bacterium]